MHLVSL